MSYAPRIAIEGLAGMERYLQRAPANAITAARLALNYAAGGPALKNIRAAVIAEINYPAGYVNTDRLSFSSRATNDNLTAVISARSRPTSLARFAVAGQTPDSTRRKGVVTVQVHRGVTRYIGKDNVAGLPGKTRSFLIRLRAGSFLSDDNFNLGLAVRLAPGETLQGSRAAVQLDANLFLLYGPSVDQVFAEIAEEQTPTILTAVENEFYRQFDRLNGS